MESRDGTPGAGLSQQDRKHAALQHRVQRTRLELMAIMRERFLAGEEHEFFEYSSRCDNNPRYDDIEQESRDAEARYFDED